MLSPTHHQHLCAHHTPAAMRSVDALALPMPAGPPGTLEGQQMRLNPSAAAFTPSCPGNSAATAAAAAASAATSTVASAAPGPEGMLTSGSSQLLRRGWPAVSVCRNIEAALAGGRYLPVWECGGGRLAALDLVAGEGAGAGGQKQQQQEQQQKCLVAVAAKSDTEGVWEGLGCSAMLGSVEQSCVGAEHWISSADEPLPFELLLADRGDAQPAVQEAYAAVTPWNLKSAITMAASSLRTSMNYPMDLHLKRL